MVQVWRKQLNKGGWGGGGGGGWLTDVCVSASHYVYSFIRTHVCIRVCVCEGERERLERQQQWCI